MHTKAEHDEEKAFAVEERHTWLALKYAQEVELRSLAAKTDEAQESFSRLCSLVQETKSLETSVRIPIAAPPPLVFPPSATDC
jgi:hypothetical protein